MRKTAKFYRDSLAGGFNEALVREVVKSYGDYGSRISLRPENFHWNHRPSGFSLDKKGNLWLGIYWQGDSTDGDNEVMVSDLLRRGTVVIPAEHFFECGRTYERHGDLRVTRDELEETTRALVEWLSPDKVKARREVKLRRSIEDLVTEYVGHELGEKYAPRGSWMDDRDRYWNGRHAVDEYVKANWKEMLPLKKDERKAVMLAVFKANHRHETRNCEGKRVYDLSYKIQNTKSL